MRRRFLTLAVCLVASSVSLLAQPEKWYKSPSDKEVAASIEKWQDLKFGMFIHWGPYCQRGIVESWSICPELVTWQMKPREGTNYFDYLRGYEDLRLTFNPTQFDPDQWASAAADAGMKYIVFTTKHHDGFCMFDTAQTDYKITAEDCPYHVSEHADISKAVFDSFRAHGLRAGAYLSVADWHHDDYWWRFFPPKDRYLNYDPQKYPEKYAGFVNFLDAQVNELTGGAYGDIDLLWLDLCEISETYKIDYPWERLAATARGNQPGLITVARGTHGEYENYHTAEQKLPEKVIDVPWECCMTMHQGWGYRFEPRYKSTRELLDLLVKIVARGGNFLLGVGPGPDGRLDEQCYKGLAEIGAWMKVNSEAIYGTSPAEPFQQDENVFYTAKGGCLYAFYLASEGEDAIPAQVVLKGVVPVKGSSVTMLGSSRKLSWRVVDGNTVVAIPSSLRSKLPCSDIWCLRIQR